MAGLKLLSSLANGTECTDQEKWVVNLLICCFPFKFPQPSLIRRHVPSIANSVQSGGGCDFFLMFLPKAFECGEHHRFYGKAGKTWCFRTLLHRRAKEYKSGSACRTQKPAAPRPPKKSHP
jgi:hypothetical protein